LFAAPLGDTMGRRGAGTGGHFAPAGFKPMDPDMAIVLIATMDSVVFDTLSAEVAGEGHEVLWASNGQDAYDQTLSRKPDLLFVENALPIFNGFELVALLRGDPDVPPALPVLLIGDDAVEPHRFERSGFTAQFPKTHGYFELREVLAAHLRPGVATW